VHSFLLVNGLRKKLNVIFFNAAETILEKLRKR
jgi:hypothetical protein